MLLFKETGKSIAIFLNVDPSFSISTIYNQSHCMQTAVRMGWIILQWISPWRTVLGSL